MPNPLLVLLAKRNKNGKHRRPEGWLRREEVHRKGLKWNDDSDGKKTHLTADKNKTLYEIKREIDVVWLKLS